SAAAVAVDSALDRAEVEGAPREVRADDSTEPLSEDERADALYRAFLGAMHQFAWSPAESRWIIIHDAHGLSSELQRQLKLAPLQTQEERDLLIRMLLDVASVDGPVDEAEQEFLLDFVDRSQLDGARPGERGHVAQHDLRRASH